MSRGAATWIASPAAVMVLGLAGPAEAQLSGSLAVATDYRLRGFSLTDRRGAVTLTAAYDHASGAYVGGALIAHDPGGKGVELLGHMAYAGVAGGEPGGPTWDVGVNTVDLSLRLDRRYSIDYTEAYVGVAQGDWSARASLAPDYPRNGVQTAYLELNGAMRPAERWRVFGHAGAVLRMGGYAGRDGRKRRVDVQAGVAREFDRGEVTLTATALFPRPEPRTSASKTGLVLGAALFF